MDSDDEEISIFEEEVTREEEESNHEDEGPYVLKNLGQLDIVGFFYSW